MRFYCSSYELRILGSVYFVINVGTYIVIKRAQKVNESRCIGFWLQLSPPEANNNNNINIKPSFFKNIFMNTPAIAFINTMQMSSTPTQ